MIFIDVFEPTNIEDLIKQSVPTIKDSFNFKGFPDYTWVDVFNRRIGVSRKKIGELLGDMSGAEEQLGRDIDRVDELWLIIEDAVYSPTLYAKKNKQTIPGIQTWIMAKDKALLRPYHKFGVSIAALSAWLYQLDKAGISHIETFNYEHTASSLIALYNSSQQREHATLKRYIRTKAVHRDWNPHVLSLMGIHTRTDSGMCRTFIGEKKAKALIDRYGTVWEVLCQDADELALTESVGIIDATKLLRAIGKIRR